MSPRTLRLAQPMMRGEDVLWLQRRLQSGPWPALAGLIRVADGLFGPRTAAAVAALQSLLGLAPDGVVGPALWSRLCPEAPAAFDPLSPAALAELARPHARFGGGVLWRLTAEGILLDRGTIAGGKAEEAMLRRVLTSFGGPIRAEARRHALPLELIAACLCTESGGDPAAERQEPGFRGYEATPHRVSIGCMQTLLSTARAVLRRPVAPEELRRPETSIAAGAACLAEAAAQTRLDPPVVACAYNAGSVRADLSETNRWRMLQYPVGTGAHADRFCGFFNVALRLVRAQPHLSENAPNFAALLGG
ncbi:transglycosylase SLT domain-containing protein [Belnapia sp. T6]|uniref:Transglycosylase SLT domain-containing protein n=1 Tax=Belnapia mucosa TaxID=2804532 RepID=A0ABS1V4C9_9PROT|nr:peptidoglycan-binding protein [Belnapia mucosa]MBL6456568.1 transglycosylase SLT domain-containing protein [Belnapia mucosa]